MSVAIPSGAFPVVGIGASAGGLEAFTALLKALPVDTGMAFVLVQHMDPVHQSALSQILSRATRMPVSEVTDGMALEPNHVYVIPPNADMTTRGGILHLCGRHEVAGRHLPVDLFLTSLASDKKSAAVGLILSGTGSDGTEGMKSIRAEGGVTFAQDEASARHAGMPTSAVAAGCVDFVLPPAKMAAEIVCMGRHPYIRIAQQAESVELAEKDGNDFRKICLLLRSSTGVDFLQYKSATLNRRIARRMLLRKVTTLEKYLHLLRKSPEELQALFQDILVHVTGFFRDPDAFQALENIFLPNLIASKPAEQPIRAWVPGCSTGEEVYSIAVLLLESLQHRSGQDRLGQARYEEDGSGPTRIQVFGSDISESSLLQARSGSYPEASLANVSQARLKRFFIKVDGGYQVTKSVREMCVFARHDLTKDPPFSNLDLISCRNVLIYLGPALQKRTIETFHYALRNGGFLFLGKSESLNTYTNLFTLENRKYKIFSRKPVATPHVDLVLHRRRKTDHPLPPADHLSGQAGMSFDLRKEAERTLLDRFAPAAIVVDSDLHIVHFQGDASPYLAPATGEASFHLLRMLRPELLVDVRAAILKAKKEGITATTRPIQLRLDSRMTSIQAEVVPIVGRREKKSDFLVLFQEESLFQEQALAQEATSEGPATGRKPEKGSSKTVGLERELASTRAYLRSMVEDHEATYEELKAANEEILSANEELQSTNEELETAKEELQSSNEELTTLNEEQHNRNAELGQLANDLSNLLVGVNIAVVILDHDLCIRRFTPTAETVLNLIPGDVGRPFRHIASTLIVDDLDAMLSEVINRLSTLEREVQDRQGHWYTLRMRPYKTGDQRDGVLMALVDIDLVKRSLEQVKKARDYAEAIVETISEPLLVLDRETHVLTANASFYQAFATSSAQTLGKSIFELGDGQWNIPQLRELLTELLPRNSRIESFPVEHEFPTIGHRHMLLDALQIHYAGVATGMVLIAIKDVTAAVEATRKIEESESTTRALLETASQAILAIDANGAIQIANRMAEAMFGYRRDEVLGRPLEILIPLRFWERHGEHRAEFFQAPYARQMGSDLLGRRKDGTEFDVEVSLSYVQTKADILAVCFVSDISERKRSEAAALLYQEELRALTARLIAAQEASSKHLARELHDVFSQKLAVLGLEISEVEHSVPEKPESLHQQLRRIAEQIGGLAKDIHHMSRRLHPAILDDLGLAAALNNECLAFSKQHGIHVEFVSRGIESPVPEDIALCLYRVAQEALRNIGRHSKTTDVVVDLIGGGGEIVLVVEDIGDGFDLADVRRKGGLGLVSMDERVRLVGGVLFMHSEPEKGTRMEVRVPLRQKSQENL